MILAQSAAQAGKLRQATPRFLAVLREQGLNVSEIRIRVQPPGLIEANDPAGSRTTDDARNLASRRLQAKAAKDFAEKLALTLRPSPLRDAAGRLARALKNVR